MSHTPGPWKWHWGLGHNLEADCGVFHEPIEGQAYSVCRCPRYQSQLQWEADARLMAAAPELLAACKGLLPFVEFLDDAGPRGEEWQSEELKEAIAATNAAVAKAEKEG
jgi:hypothetical protein